MDVDISGTPDQCINALSRALVAEGIDADKAYSTVKQIYADPDQSDPSCKHSRTRMGIG